MRHFRVIVNGLAYEVEVEELASDTASPQPPNPMPAAAAAPAAASLAAARAAAEPTPASEPAKAKHAKRPSDSPVAGPGVVPSPLPGTVLDVKVHVGDAVTEGQVVAILEAMKMENEITAPHAGSVTAVHVKAGSAVGLGDALIEIG